MASTKLTLLPTIAQATSAHDFVTPQISLASLEIFKRHELESSRTYLLHQTSLDRQTLTPLSDTSGSSYTIKSHLTGGFMNRKPHMVIRKEQEGRNSSVVSAKSREGRRRSSIFGTEKEQGGGEFAEVRFEIGGTGTEIFYRESGHKQVLALQSSLDQTYSCPIGGRKHWWRPLGPSRTVLELVNGEEERVALFMYTSEVALTTGVGTGRKASLSTGQDVGELHILEDIEGGFGAQEEVLCSALAVVERAKRRAANVGRTGSAYKQGASCGITQSAYGGGL